VRGINLAPRNGSLMRGSSEALVRVTVAEQRQDRSNVLSTTKDTRALPGCNPHWEQVHAPHHAPVLVDAHVTANSVDGHETQELLFFVADPHACTVSLTVLDEQLAKQMGSVSMRLGDLLKQAGTHQVHNTWYLEVSPSLTVLSRSEAVGSRMPVRHYTHTLQGGGRVRCSRAVGGDAGSRASLRARWSFCWTGRGHSRASLLRTSPPELLARKFASRTFARRWRRPTGIIFTGS